MVTLLLILSCLLFKIDESEGISKIKFFDRYSNSLIRNIQCINTKKIECFEEFQNCPSKGDDSNYDQEDEDRLQQEVQPNDPDNDIDGDPSHEDGDLYADYPGEDAMAKSMNCESRECFVNSLFYKRLERTNNQLCSNESYHYPTYNLFEDLLEYKMILLKRYYYDRPYHRNNSYYASYKYISIVSHYIKKVSYMMSLIRPNYVGYRGKGSYTINHSIMWKDKDFEYEKALNMMTMMTARDYPRFLSAHSKNDKKMEDQFLDVVIFGRKFNFTVTKNNVERFYRQVYLMINGIFIKRLSIHNRYFPFQLTPKQYNRSMEYAKLSLYNELSFDGIGNVSERENREFYRHFCHGYHSWYGGREPYKRHAFYGNHLHREICVRLPSSSKLLTDADMLELRNLFREPPLVELNFKFDNLLELAAYVDPETGLISVTNVNVAFSMLQRHHNFNQGMFPYMQNIGYRECGFNENEPVIETGYALRFLYYDELLVPYISFDLSLRDSLEIGERGLYMYSKIDGRYSVGGLVIGVSSNLRQGINYLYKAEGGVWTIRYDGLFYQDFKINILDLMSALFGRKIGLITRSPFPKNNCINDDDYQDDEVRVYSLSTVEMNQLHNLILRNSSYSWKRFGITGNFSFTKTQLVVAYVGSFDGRSFRAAEFIAFKIVSPYHAYVLNGSNPDISGLLTGYYLNDDDIDMSPGVIKYEELRHVQESEEAEDEEFVQKEKDYELRITLLEKGFESMEKGFESIEKDIDNITNSFNESFVSLVDYVLEVNETLSKKILDINEIIEGIQINVTNWNATNLLSNLTTITEQIGDFNNTMYMLNYTRILESIRFLNATITQDWNATNLLSNLTTITEQIGDFNNTMYMLNYTRILESVQFLNATITQDSDAFLDLRNISNKHDELINMIMNDFNASQTKIMDIERSFATLDGGATQKGVSVFDLCGKITRQDGNIMKLNYTVLLINETINQRIDEVNVKLDAFNMECDINGDVKECSEFEILIAQVKSNFTILDKRVMNIKGQVLNGISDMINFKIEITDQLLTVEENFSNTTISLKNQANLILNRMLKQSHRIDAQEVAFSNLSLNHDLLYDKIVSVNSDLIASNEMMKRESMLSSETREALKKLESAFLSNVSLIESMVMDAIELRKDFSDTVVGLNLTIDNMNETLYELVTDYEHYDFEWINKTVYFNDANVSLILKDLFSLNDSLIENIDNVKVINVSLGNLTTLHTEDVDWLMKMITTNELNITKLDDHFRRQNESLNVGLGKIDELKDNLTTVSSDLRNVNNSVLLIDERVITAELNILKLTNQTQELNLELKVINDTLVLINDGMATIEANLTKFQNDLRDNSAMVEQLGVEVKSLDVRVKSIEEDVGTPNPENGSTTTTVTTPQATTTDVTSTTQTTVTNLPTTSVSTTTKLLTTTTKLPMTTTNVPTVTTTNLPMITPPSESDSKSLIDAISRLMVTCRTNDFKWFVVPSPGLFRNKDYAYIDVHGIMRTRGYVESLFSIDYYPNNVLENWTFKYNGEINELTYICVISQRSSAATRFQLSNVTYGYTSHFLVVYGVIQHSSNATLDGLLYMNQFNHILV